FILVWLAFGNNAVIFIDTKVCLPQETPAIVKSYYDKRIVGCPSGEGEEEHDVVWFWLEKGKSFECPVCTHWKWLVLVDLPMVTSSSFVTMWRRIVSSGLKTLASDLTASSPPCRSIATTVRPAGSYLAASRSAISASSSVIPRHFSSESVETVAKKKVEDVMPIATGHEKEELEAELEVISNLLHFVQMRVYCNSICDHDCHLYNHSWRNNLA
ncbi:hypothetical protein IGI04_011928, partial [Brassica rapa subsp. trilocularis]